MNTSIPGFETVLFHKERGIAHVTLNRPRVFNIYNIQMRDELWEILLAIRDDPEIKAVILDGAGDKAFCAGADLTEFGTAPSQTIARRVRFERGIWELWLSIPKPFICCLHGYVLGSGLEMALFCDIRLASVDAVFSLPELSLGLIPGAGASQTLPRQIGLSAALFMLLSGHRLNSSEALHYGLIHRICDPANLISLGKDVAEDLSHRDSHILSALKTSVTDGFDLPLLQGLALESRLAYQTLA